MRIPTLILSVAIAAALAAPAQATTFDTPLSSPLARWSAAAPAGATAAPDSRYSPTGPNPAAAALLSVLAPAAITAGGLVVVTKMGSSGFAILGLVPLGAGVGHLYAGDAQRGLWVSAGGVAVGAAAAGLMMALNSSGGSTGGPPAPGAGTAIPVLGYLAASSVYSLWAAYDAWKTAERIAASAQ